MPPCWLEIVEFGDAFVEPTGGSVIKFPLCHANENVFAAGFVTVAATIPLSAPPGQFVEGVGTALIAGNTWLFLISVVTGEEMHPRTVLVIVAV